MKYAIYFYIPLLFSLMTNSVAMEDATANQENYVKKQLDILRRMSAYHLAQTLDESDQPDDEHLFAVVSNPSPDDINVRLLALESQYTPLCSRLTRCEELLVKQQLALLRAEKKYVEEVIAGATGMLLAYVFLGLLHHLM